MRRSCCVARNLLAGIALTACGPQPNPPQIGSATGSIAATLLGPAPSLPPGQGEVQLAFGTDFHRTLAQGSSVFAVDSAGNETGDASQASYFSVEVYQYTSPTELELFEFQLLPQVWAPGQIPIDGLSATGFYGLVNLDAAGAAVSSTIEAATTGGVLDLEQTGLSEGEPVQISFADVPLVTQ